MNTLFQFADKNNILVEYCKLPQTLSVCTEFCEQQFIGMDYSLLFDTPNERVHLAHELGHCITGSFYNAYAKIDIRAKHENRANKWAYHQLLPHDKLMEVVTKGETEVWEIAERFDLPCEFVAKAIEYYKTQVALY